MLILVTGATGTVGSQTIGFLANKPGVRVRVGAHHPEKARGLADGNVEVVPLDFLRIDTIDTALEGVDRVFLLTPAGQEGKEMALRAIDVMMGRDLRQVVRMSILNADKEPGIGLTRDHREVEQALIDNGLPWTFLRPNSFMENLIALAATVRQQGKLALPLADQRVSYIASRDIGAVAASVLTTDGHSGKVYELTGPQALSGNEIAQTLTDVLGREISYMPISEDEMRRSLAGMPPECVEQSLELWASHRAGAGARVTNTVQSITGHAPTLFRDWLRPHAAVFAGGEQRAA